MSWFRRVSIPFKRDNSSERELNLSHTEGDKVSIPFKRDNSSELTDDELHLQTKKQVSIPFKRDNSSELKNWLRIVIPRWLCFNSLQTG